MRTFSVLLSIIGINLNFVKKENIQIMFYRFTNTSILKLHTVKKKEFEDYKLK